MSRAPAFDEQDQALLKALLKERETLSAKLAETQRQLDAISNKALAEKFEVHPQTIINYVRMLTTGRIFVTDRRN